MAREQTDPRKAKSQAIELAVASIEKQFGKGAIMVMGQDAIDREMPIIPTGSPSLDIALGVGGLPRGRVTEIFGPESSGKTTLALHVIAECQRQGGAAAFIDAEHAMDVAYAAKLGVNIDELLVSQPDTGEQALEIADMLVLSGAIELVVIDSVAALVPRAEIEGEIEARRAAGEGFDLPVDAVRGHDEDRALAELLLDGGDRQRDGLLLVGFP